MSFNHPRGEHPPLETTVPPSHEPVEPAPRDFGLDKTKHGIPAAPAVTIDAMEEFVQSPTEAYPAETSEDQTKIPLGETFTDAYGNQYRVDEKLGEGGMGGVYKVEDLRLGLPRAVKFMHAEARNVPSMMARFQREIEVLGQMENPFIVAANKVIRVTVDEQETVGLVMDYVEGTSLDRLVKDRLEPDRVAVLSAQMCFALESLRKAGIVHRDFKPANILIHEMPDGEQFVRIGDFGIAGFAFEKDQPLATDETTPALPGRTVLTQSGSFLGTPAYASPESVKSMPVDHRSDLYSLGLVMYKMTTGAEPFQEVTDPKANKKDQVHAQLKAHMESKPKSFGERGVKEVPAWLEAIVFKLLDKDPDQRFQSAAEVFVALKQGVKESHPEMLSEIPFIWDVKPPEHYATPTEIAA
ncbi:MAG: serine/threonine-protein kinase [Patescibacteria group bacterium]